MSAKACDVIKLGKDYARGILTREEVLDTMRQWDHQGLVDDNDWASIMFDLGVD